MSQSSTTSCESHIPTCCECDREIELMCWDCPENSHCEDCCDCWWCEECGKKSYNGQYHVEDPDNCIHHDPQGKGCVYIPSEEIQIRIDPSDMGGEDDDDLWNNMDGECCRECMVSKLEEYVDAVRKRRANIGRWERLTCALLKK